MASPQTIPQGAFFWLDAMRNAKPGQTCKYKPCSKPFDQNTAGQVCCSRACAVLRSRERNRQRK